MMTPSANWPTGLPSARPVLAAYRLYKPPGVRRDESLPLLVILHGCGQDAEALAASSWMNITAARERFFRALSGAGSPVEYTGVLELV